MTPESTTHRALAQLFDAVQRPIYLLDQHRQIAFCNRALADWLQMDTDDVLGRQVEYHSEPAAPDSDALRAKSRNISPPLNSLCPPPAALAGEEAVGTVSSVDRQGRLTHRAGRFMPLGNQAQPPPGDRQPGESATVLAILDSHDMSVTEVAASLGSDPTADELHRAIRRFRRSATQQYAIESLVGESPAMVKVQAQVRAAALSGANVLIVGRPGSGRSHVARAIHYAGGDGERHPLVPLDSHVLTPESIRRALDQLEQASEKAAAASLLFTDADALSAEIQLQLVATLAARRSLPRLMATVCPTSSDQSDDEEEDELRSGGLHLALADFFSTITITLPRLVDRLEDLPLLAQLFLEAANKNHSRQVGSIDPTTLQQLALYGWPGELEELKQVLVQAHGNAQSAVIQADDLPDVIHHATQAAAIPNKPADGIVLDEFLGRIERELIQRALREASGNKTEAARLLGMSRARLYRRLEQLGLENQQPDTPPS